MSGLVHLCTDQRVNGPCLFAAWRSGGLMETPPPWNATIYTLLRIDRTDSNLQNPVCSASSEDILHRECLVGHYDLACEPGIFKYLHQVPSHEATVNYSITWTVSPITGLCIRKYFYRPRSEGDNVLGGVRPSVSALTAEQFDLRP